MKIKARERSGAKCGVLECQTHSYGTGELDITA